MSSVSQTQIEVEQLREKLLERDAKNAALRRKNAELEAQLKKVKAELAQLRREVKKLLGHTPRSKHLIDEGQLSLFGDVGPADPEPEETPEHAKEAPDGETPDDSIRNRYKPKRRAKKVDMSLLPRETVFHELPKEDRQCRVTGHELVKVGEEVSEELVYDAAKLRVIEHRRAKYGLAPEMAKDFQVPQVLAPQPIMALEGCMASASLLAHLLVQKYVHHLPLYRQEEMFQSAGLFIPRQTLCDWVMKAAFALQPIVEEVETMIREGPVFQLDDTPVKCQGGKGHGNFQAYLWVFANPQVPGVVFRFTKGRSTKDLAPLLKGVKARVVVGDGYAANKSGAAEAKLKVDHAACWAHVVRKFRDAGKEAPSLVKLFRNDLRALYDIEDEATQGKLDADGRAELRRRKGRQIVARMLARTLGWKEDFSLQGKMAEAIKYLRKFTTGVDDLLGRRSSAD